MAGENEKNSGTAGQGYGATLWEPDAETVRNARVTHYIRWLADRVIDTGDPRGTMPAAAYQRLWEWSVANRGDGTTPVLRRFDHAGSSAAARHGATGPNQVRGDG